jgi:hypothetical protein
MQALHFQEEACTMTEGEHGYFRHAPFLSENSIPVFPFNVPIPLLSDCCPQENRRTETHPTF